MSKDLLKRAEAMLKDGYCNEDHETYEGCWTCEVDMESIIQELLDKIKGDAERLNVETLVEKVHIAIQYSDAQIATTGYQTIMSSNIAQAAAIAAINVIKGDDNDS